MKKGKPVQRRAGQYRVQKETEAEEPTRKRAVPKTVMHLTTQLVSDVKAKDNAIQVEGTVLETLPNAMFPCRAG